MVKISEQKINSNGKKKFEFEILYKNLKKKYYEKNISLILGWFYKFQTKMFENYDNLYGSMKF